MPQTLERIAHDDTAGLRVVVIGGGTGSFTLLGALKDYTKHITALVNMADDGGSTGQLRDEHGVLPPGDVRQCLVALSNKPQLRDLFNYRFDGGGMHGHAFGNIFLSALEKMSGDFGAGVELASQLLNITGKVEPITLTNVQLMLKDGEEVLRGESVIGNAALTHKHPEVWLEPSPVANPKAVGAIKDADIVVIAPGKLYSSLAPALVVPGIGEALAATKASVLYVCNLVTKPGQTDGFTVCDFASEIERLSGAALDGVIYNTAKPSVQLLKKYAADGELAVEYDDITLKNAHFQAFGAPLVAGAAWENPNSSDPIAHERTLIRHDSDAVAQALFNAHDSLVARRAH